MLQQLTCVGYDLCHAEVIIKHASCDTCSFAAAYVRCFCVRHTVSVETAHQLRLHLPTGLPGAGCGWQQRAAVPV